MFSTNHIKIIQEKYCKIFRNSDIKMCDIDPVAESIQTTTRYEKRKDIFSAIESHQIQARSCDFIFHTRDPSKLFWQNKKNIQSFFCDREWCEWIEYDIPLVCKH